MGEENEAEAMLSRLLGGLRMATKYGFREFLRHPAGRIALTGFIIAMLKLILWLLEHR